MIYNKGKWNEHKAAAKLEIHSMNSESVANEGNEANYECVPCSEEHKSNTIVRVWAKPDGNYCGKRSKLGLK